MSAIKSIRTRKTFVRQYLLFFSPIAVLVIAFSIYLYRLDLNNKITSLKKEAVAVLKLKEDLINHELQMMRSDLQILVANDEIYEYYDTPSTQSFLNLKKEYLLFSKEKGIYDQIRIIDLRGNEILRIDNKDGQTIVVDSLHLQNKADRYYFKEISNLEEGEIYISSLDLNIENDKIEIPYKPMIRMGISFFYNGSRKGMIVANFKAKKFLEYVSKPYLNVPDEKMLLDPDGYWLLSDNSEEEWGFMFDDKKDVTFPNKYPEAWLAVSENHNGQIKKSDGIFTFATIYYRDTGGASVKQESSLNSVPYWKLVSFISNSTLSEVASPIFWRRIIIGLVFLFGAAIALVFIVNLRVKNLMAQKEIRDKVSILTRQNKERNKFMAIFSHDLKNSIGTLHNYSILLKEDYYELDDLARLGFIRGMEDMSGNTMNLLLTLLEWSRSNSDSNVDKRRMINLFEIVNRNIDLLKHEAKAKYIKLESTVRYDEEIYADENIVNALLRNFIFNAIKFTHEGGMIKIYARMCNDDKLNVVVEDNGIGMTEEQIKKVLDPNEKYTTRGTKEESGSGMGLALCKELIENNNGELKIESTPGVGSKFCFNLSKDDTDISSKNN